MVIDTQVTPPVTQQPATVTRRDRVAITIVLVASILSVASYVYFYQRGTILAYQDAISHLAISRRVIDSPTTGFGQLGGVWLPLPHLLTLPFVWSNLLYFSGFASSFVSMASYVVTSLYLYKIVVTLTGKRLAGVVGATVFMVNPNVLYMQATPMTEMLLFACISAMAYYTIRWIQTDRYQDLIAAGGVAFLASLTRYEAWVYLLAIFAVVVFAVRRKRYGDERGEALILAFCFTAFLGIGAWLLWNTLIFGNPLNWQNGEYAKPSLWVGKDDIAVGDWLISIKTYWFAMVEDLGIVVVSLMIGGLVVIALKERLQIKIWPVLALLSLFPFFVIALERGQRPLHVMELSGSLYNIRFGLLMILPAAILIGYLTSLLRVVAVVAIGLVIALSGIAFSQNAIATEREPTAWQQISTNTEAMASVYLHQNYQSGNILGQFFSNETLLFNAGITPGTNIYEGSYKAWTPSLEDPLANDIKWIVMRRTAGSEDLVYQALGNNPVVLNGYQLAYQNVDFQIYVRTS